MKLINKIKRADHTKKTELFLAEGVDRNELVREMVLALPKGYYCLRNRELGDNLIDTMFQIYGWMPSLMVSEATLLGLQATHPKKVYASFTLGLDTVEIK
jgi:hypothetical protein